MRWCATQIVFYKEMSHTTTTWMFMGKFTIEEHILVSRNENQTKKVGYQSLINEWAMYSMMYMLLPTKS